MARALLLALAFTAFASSASFAGELALRASPTTDGPAVTLGDLFENAGPAAERAIAPSPAPGRTSAYSAEFVAAAARAAGLSWTPPQGVTQIAVTRRGGSGAAASVRPGTSQAVAAGVRRGEPVTLTFEAPGLRLTAKARALHDAGAGERVRLQNLQSNRTIDAIVTGPGAATAAPAG